MKQLNRSVAIVLICAMMLMMAACEQTKSYATLEEWYADHPLSEDLTHKVIKEEGLPSLTLARDMIIAGNEIIFKCTFSKKVFGEDEKLDEIYFKAVDKAAYEEQDNIKELIKILSERSGIAKSQISVRYDFYNPGDPTPSYTISKDYFF